MMTVEIELSIVYRAVYVYATSLSLFHTHRSSLYDRSIEYFGVYKSLRNVFNCKEMTPTCHFYMEIHHFFVVFERDVFGIILVQFQYENTKVKCYFPLV